MKLKPALAFAAGVVVIAVVTVAVMHIRQQIEQALMQFPTVHKVVIAIEGETEGVLQP